MLTAAGLHPKCLCEHPFSGSAARMPGANLPLPTQTSDNLLPRASLPAQDRLQIPAGKVEISKEPSTARPGPAEASPPPGEPGGCSGVEALPGSLPSPKGGSESFPREGGGVCRVDLPSPAQLRALTRRPGWEPWTGMAGYRREGGSWWQPLPSPPGRSLCRRRSRQPPPAPHPTSAKCQQRGWQNPAGKGGKGGEGGERANPAPSALLEGTGARKDIHGGDKKTSPGRRRARGHANPEILQPTVGQEPRLRRSKGRSRGDAPQPPENLRAQPALGKAKAASAGWFLHTRGLHTRVHTRAGPRLREGMLGTHARRAAEIR